MHPAAWRSDLLLLLTSIVWGFAFVAQKVGMDHVGPFTFNGVRFALGALVLIPLERRLARRTPAPATPPAATEPAGSRGPVVRRAGGVLAGLLLFGGASLQQVGLQWTTTANAGFITGLNVVIVPILGLLLSQRARRSTWMGAMLAAIGLYLLSVTESFTLRPGDGLELLGACFWAGHVVLVGWLSPRGSALRLAIIQYLTCSVLSLAVAACREPISALAIRSATGPILYGGVLSVGVGYTLQVVAQRRAPPAHAAVILSLEAVFAAIGGWWLLGEGLGARGLVGCSLMLAGMLVSQLGGRRARAPRTGRAPERGTIERT